MRVIIRGRRILKGGDPERIKEKLRREGWKILDINAFTSRVIEIQKKGIKAGIKIAHRPEHYDFFIEKVIP